MSVDNSYLVIDLKKRKSNIFSCRFVMRKMRSLVSFETETKRGKYVIPASPYAIALVPEIGNLS